MNNPHSLSARKIPVVFCVDIEPDEFFVDRADPKPWFGFEFSHRYLESFRALCEKATGQPARFNWFVRMDPQVAIGYGSAAWAAERYADFFEQYRAHGDEIGIHVHTYNWSKSLGTWIDDCGNEEWTAHCLQSSTASFKQVFGYQPRSLRFGNFWLSTAAVNQAEELGIEFDLTIEPGLDASKWEADKKPRETGVVPSYCGIPSVPYTPSRRDFRKRHLNGDSRNITMMPLTAAHRALGWSLRDVRRRLGRVRRNGLSSRNHDEPLSMWKGDWTGENHYGAMLDRAIELQQRPYLAFAVRSDINGKEFAAYERCLSALAEHPAAPSFVFCSPRDAMRCLEGNASLGEMRLTVASAAGH
jgi:hypothetical protein